MVKIMIASNFLYEGSVSWLHLSHNSVDQIPQQLSDSLCSFILNAEESADLPYTLLAKFGLPFVLEAHISVFIDRHNQFVFLIS